MAIPRIVTKPVCAAALTAAIAVFPAYAEDLTNPDFSASGSVGVSNLIVPQNQFILNREDVNPFRSLGAVETDPGYGLAPHLQGEVAYRLTSGGDGMPALGIAVTGDFQYLSLSEASEFQDNGPTVSFGFASFSGFGLRSIDGFSLFVRSEREFMYAASEVHGTAEYPLAKDVALSLFAGPSARVLHETTDLNVAIGGTVNTMNLSEQIETTYLGGTIGASVAGDVSDRWSMAVRGSFSLYHANSEYDGFYDDNQANDEAKFVSASTLAHGLALDVSLDRHFGDKVTLGGILGVDYLSDSPQMRYPGPVTAPDNDDVIIGFHRLISVSAGAKLSVRF